MFNPDYQLRISVPRTSREVYQCLTSRLREWWTDDVQGASGQPGDAFTVRFGNSRKTMRIAEMIPDQTIVWHCTDAFIEAPGLQNKHEWIGTRIIWRIVPDGKATTLTLLHEGLNPAIECYQVCEKGWTHFLTGSLYNLLTISEGQPYQNRIADPTR
jgi:hypothetical protein